MMIVAVGISFASTYGRGSGWNRAAFRTNGRGSFGIRTVCIRDLL